MKLVSRFLSRLDSAIYVLERALLVFATSAMVLLVFGDVVQRTFSRPMSGQMQALIAGTSFVVVLLATRSSRKKSWPLSLFWGALIWGIVVGAVGLLIYFFPSGIPGAQKFALGFMMWAAFLGASLATRSRRHIAMNALSKRVDPKAQAFFSMLGGLLTSLFCFYLLSLARLQFVNEYTDWASAPGIGVFEALPIPMWLVTLCLPVNLLLIGVRFFANGIRDFVHGAPDTDEIVEEIRKQEALS